MPELPEVETIVRDLRPRLVGRTLGAVSLSHDDVLRGTTRRRLLGGLRGATVRSVSRRAKHAVLDLGRRRLVVQPGMTGSLQVHDRRLTPDERRYAVLTAELDNGRRLVYRDVRRLGTLLLLDERGWAAYDRAIGPEPLDTAFAAGDLGRIVSSSRQAVKKVLMDQRHLAGVGNIYANEALFAAGVDPSRAACSLRPDEAAGLAVTAEVAPHHLVLTTEEVGKRGTDAKMNPPLASDADREALRAAIADGTLDCVATDHAPHTDAEKRRGLALAPFGVVGLETAFAVLYTTLVERGVLPLATLVRRMSADAARALGLEAPAVRPGARADLAAFDLATEWIVDPARFRSRGRSTPFGGWRLHGRPVLTVAGGVLAYDGREPR